MNKMRDAILTLLESPVSEKNMDVLQKLGFEKEDMTNMALLVASVYDKALKGNASALKFIAYFLVEEEEEETTSKLSELMNEMKARKDIS